MKKFLMILLAALVIIQFFRPTKNINTTDTAKQNHISKALAVPNDVEQILKISCYDCHSNNTVYPWYANIQPVAWWLNHHIEEGKEELNFDEFANYKLRRQYHKLEEIEEQVKDGEMPLSSYTIIHKNAVLNENQKQTLYNWVTALQNTMKEKYPIDSLIKKKK